MSADERQYLAMPLDYRAALRQNVARLFEYHEVTRLTARVYYKDGPKKGKRVAPRTLGYILSDRPDKPAPSPSLDIIAAIAAAYDLMPWQLMVPGFDPANAPTTRLTPEERKLHADFERLRAAIAASATAPAS